MTNLEKYIEDNKADHEGIVYLKTSVDKLAKALDTSESTIKRQLNTLVKKGSITKVTKKGNNGGLALFMATDLDKLKIARETKPNLKLSDLLFPKEGTYEPTGARRNKEEMAEYNAEKLKMANEIKRYNQLFQEAFNHFKGFDYNETFGKLDNASEVYRVFLASRVYDAYTIAFDKRYREWYREDKELGTKVKYTRGREKIYHNSTYRSLKMPFLGTRAYTYAKKLVDTADMLKISVPAYVYNIMERYAWKNAYGYSKPYVPSLNQITDKNHLDMAQKFLAQREYNWLVNGHQYSYDTMNSTDVMYATLAYNLFTAKSTITPNDVEPIFSQTDTAIGYARFYDYALAEIDKLDLSENDKFWYYQYAKEQVALAVGSMTPAYKRMSPILSYLVNNNNGIYKTYKEWVKEDGGDATQAAMDLYGSIGKDVNTTSYPMSQESYEDEVIDNLDDIQAIHDEYKAGTMRDVMSLELTRKNNYARLNVQQVIKELTPVLRLSDKGFINRQEIKAEFLNERR